MATSFPRYQDDIRDVVENHLPADYLLKGIGDRWYTCVDVYYYVLRHYDYNRWLWICCSFKFSPNVVNRKLIQALHDSKNTLDDLYCGRWGLILFEYVEQYRKRKQPVVCLGKFLPFDIVQEACDYICLHSETGEILTNK